MRYTTVLLAFFTLACSKTESPSQATPETKAGAESEVGAAPAPEADPQRIWVEPPTVELIAKGKPPLRKIRWSFQEGAKEVMVLTTTQAFEMKGGGWDGRKVPTGIAQTIDFTTKVVSADGTAEVIFHVREAVELETPDANSAAMLNAKDWTGTYKVDSKGVIQDLLLVPSADTIYKPIQMPALNNALRWSVFPVPDEPIGVGAKWTVTQVVHEEEIPMTVRTAIELVELDGSDMVLRVEIKGGGAKHLNVGGQQQTISMESYVHDLAKLSLTKLVPRSSEYENHTVQTVNVAGVQGPMGRLDVIIDRKVMVKSD